MTQKKSMEISHMKKTLLAAALMVGFAGVAQAETSVTLYGVVDGGIGYQRLKGSAAGDIEGMGLYDHDRGTSFRNTRTGLFDGGAIDRKSTRLNSSHVAISYAVFCLKKKK